MQSLFVRKSPNVLRKNTPLPSGLSHYTNNYVSSASKPGENSMFGKPSEPEEQTMRALLRVLQSLINSR